MLINSQLHLIRYLKFKNVNYLILNLNEYNKIFKIYKIKEKTLLKKLIKLQRF